MAVTTNKKAGGFFKSVKAELKKVSWPTKRELKDYTIVVLVMCTLMMAGIYVFDLIFRGALQLFL
ncbi:MAG: preprotein translocase subunit SecE [Clostridia bacterium]|nr:preprotein translocase subunit SecE [Clostridia bacterium]